MAAASAYTVRLHGWQCDDCGTFVCRCHDTIYRLWNLSGSDKSKYANHALVLCMPCWNIRSRCREHHSGYGGNSAEVAVQQARNAKRADVCDATGERNVACSHCKRSKP